MVWFDWLRKQPAPVIDHSRFGRVRASHRPSSGTWLWETLDMVDTPRGEVSLTFDADESGPTAAHERQFDHMLDNLDWLTETAVPMLASELKDFLDFGGLKFPADPWAELEWIGGHLTGVGSELEVQYGYRSWPDAMITVYFENDRPTTIQIDD